MQWWQNTDWMKSPNFKMIVYVLLAVTAVIGPSLSSSPVWSTIITSIVAGLLVLKAYTSNPDNPVLPDLDVKTEPKEPPVVVTDEKPVFVDPPALQK